MFDTPEEIAADLAATMSGPEPGPGAWWDADETVPPADADEANRMLWRLGAVEREQGTVNDLANREVNRVESWRAGRLAILARQQAYLEAALEGWGRAVWQAKGPQTRNLPNGKIAAAKRRKRVEALVDGEQFEGLVERVEALAELGLVKIERTVKRQRVDQVAEPGEEVAPAYLRAVGGDSYEVPEGYVARHAVLAGRPEGTPPVVIPGVILLVPRDDVTGRKFSVTPSGNAGSLGVDEGEAW